MAYEVVTSETFSGCFESFREVLRVYQREFAASEVPMSLDLERAQAFLQVVVAGGIPQMALLRLGDYFALVTTDAHWFSATKVCSVLSVAKASAAPRSPLPFEGAEHYGRDHGAETMCADVGISARPQAFGRLLRRLGYKPLGGLWYKPITPDKKEVLWDLKP